MRIECAFNCISLSKEKQNKKHETKTKKATINSKMNKKHNQPPMMCSYQHADCCNCQHCRRGDTDNQLLMETFMRINCVSFSRTRKQKQKKATINSKINKNTIILQ